MDHLDRASNNGSRRASLCALLEDDVIFTSHPMDDMKVGYHDLGNEAAAKRGV